MSELCQTCAVGYHLPSGKCDHCDSPVSSELAPSKIDGPAKVVAAVATCSLPVVEAEALERQWSEDVQWWRERAKSQIEKGHPLLAELSSHSANVLSGCAAQLGRLIAQSKSRQPEENAQGQTDAGDNQ